MTAIARYATSLVMFLLPAQVAVCAQEHPPSSVPSQRESNTELRYASDIQPIFNRRCVACHGCLASPCNVKLDSFRGVERGGFGKNPYSTHFGAFSRTDMEVVQTTEEWRDRGFYPILFRAGDEEENLDKSLIYRMLASGYAHNKPEFSRQALMPLYANRYKHQCASSPSSLETQLAANPAGGMPFGLPSIDPAEFETLQDWVAQGSPGPAESDLRDAETIRNPHVVGQWEAFFNARDKRRQLVARYIFDHVFLATIVVEESPGDFFRLVRSKTPPTFAPGDSDKTVTIGVHPVDVIDTPLPYDDPYTYAGVDEFYYRFKKITTPIVQKNHFVWRLSVDDIDHLKSLFFAADWEKDADLDPPWGVGNPFQTFRAIPAEARYRFLLENSEMVLSGIIYGPVCLGQTATYAIKDHFWVYFIDPKHDVSVQDPELGLSTWDVFMDRSILGNAEYEAAYAKALSELAPNGYSIDAIWDGDKTNSNAWLTVLRHETNVSIMKGAQGGMPRTQWLMGYSGFERIYYDTVATFKYWEGDAAKLETLVFFNYLRQEFEDNFLLLLPEDERRRIRSQWSQGLGAIGLFLVPFAGQNQPAQIKIDRRHPLRSIVDRIQTHLGSEIRGPVDRLNSGTITDVSLNDSIETYDEWVEAVATLTVTTRYKFPRYLPSVTLLRLDQGDESRVYSLIANRVYKTQFSLVFQNGEALPDEDTMSVYETVVGGFPNIFMALDLNQAPEFLRELRGIETLEHWLAFRDKYAILRNSAQFWATYDWITDWNFRNRGVDAGYLDLSYYDLFDSIY